MSATEDRYPQEAYAPNGDLWWKLDTHPGQRRPYGDERKIAAWLAHNRAVGETFTMRELRAAIGGEAKPNDAEHLNRRLRELRKTGWLLPSAKDDATLATNEYRVDQVGWHPGLPDARPSSGGVSQSMARRVYDRDGRRCVVCGVGSLEPYPGEPGSVARLTVGHRVPANRGSKVRSLDELQAECARCNETVRDEMYDPVTLPEVLPDVRRLNRQEREELLQWITAGRRLRSRLDDVHNRVRMLTPDERETVADELRRMLGHAE